MSLLELLGTPAPIRTSFVTRWSPSKCCVEVQCTCGTWYRKTHNANCPYCNIDLVEQAAPATVATPEPAAVEVAAPQENATEATPVRLTAMSVAMMSAEE